MRPLLTFQAKNEDGSLEQSGYSLFTKVYRVITK